MMQRMLKRFIIHRRRWRDYLLHRLKAAAPPIAFAMRNAPRDVEDTSVAPYHAVISDASRALLA